MDGEGLNSGQNSHCALLAIAQNKGKVVVAEIAVAGEELAGG